MPFNREYIDGEWVINRNRTGPPAPPTTGVTRGADGVLIADSTEVAVPPAKIIPVTMPGPRERVIDSNGNMAPRWHRFFQELHRRTGFLEDNINAAPSRNLGSSTTIDLTLASAVPSLLTTVSVSKASVAISSDAPTISVA